jgi:predicted dehydrogenase
MISWGFLGAGWVAAKAVAPAVHNSKNAKLRAVASRDPKRAALLEPEKSYKNYEDLLTDPEIDAVYINLANHQHYEWTLKALSAGKDVLCEKPLALNLEQCEEMSRVAKDNNQLLVEAVWNQWHPRFIRACNLVNSGGIGELKNIDSSFGFTANLNQNYRNSPEMGGGSLLDVGIYQTHTWASLLSEEPELEIKSLQQNFSQSRVDLSTKLQGTLGSKVEVSANCSFESAENQSIKISGDSGTIEFLGNDAFTSWNSLSSLRINNQIEEFAPIDPYRTMIENVSAKIMGIDSWVLPIKNSLFAVKLLDQIGSFNK